MKRIYIRADGGKELGMGHIVRTSVLAEVLQNYAYIEYICYEEYTQGLDYLRAQGYNVWENKEHEILNYILERRPDVMITDHYGIDEFYMQKVKEVCKKVIYIDDDGLKNFNADVIINQNYKAEQLKYGFGSYEQCKLLTGSKYLMLREDFRECEPIQIRKDVTDILITVGGGDPHNITNTILSQVNDQSYHFHVVIGGNFPYEEQLRKDYSNPNIHFYNQPEMSLLMSRVDMAISSCGSTLYELGTLGIPTLGIIVADNQEGLATRLHEDGVIWLLGKKDGIENMQLAEKIRDLDDSYIERKRMNGVNPTLFNKNGVDEIVKVILANDR